ncbi:hypothetical protein BT96DRAFT_223554 [Gymnopus androsaceus JB14]|uniref:Uncharacterized protein n=1 Tax=Gymnopus androsaceus JB14 TaxID=1447944 RepID=A0A6A4IC09_9AGAR|nr:hypothetical protein BT96DRAFT_223554 [Gymnopus androsaceus JB14]
MTLSALNAGQTRNRAFSLSVILSCSTQACNASRRISDFGVTIAWEFSCAYSHSGLYMCV